MKPTILIILLLALSGCATARKAEPVAVTPLPANLLGAQDSFGPYFFKP